MYATKASCSLLIRCRWPAHKDRRSRLLRAQRVDTIREMLDARDRLDRVRQLSEKSPSIDRPQLLIILGILTCMQVDEGTAGPLGDVRRHPGPEDRADRGRTRRCRRAILPQRYVMLPHRSDPAPEPEERGTRRCAGTRRLRWGRFLVDMAEGELLARIHSRIEDGCRTINLHAPCGIVEVTVPVTPQGEPTRRAPSRSSACQASLVEPAFLSKSPPKRCGSR
ncbi:hypothetical protein BDN71DRAFT_508100 [Pleurotus eryngii]|uniref:Uncharacterized protein n=1 Tax=Pleurotus eryngii TaxID=5323 RepID=A0A9P6DK85_PLEER|nr:hypothetical protein BDN71DRAFT_508100 [Pleurotus eryngii]